MGNLEEKSKKMTPLSQIHSIVGRPMIELRDRRGERVIVKIKWEDFKHFTT